jgi:hypothetical protein
VDIALPPFALGEEGLKVEWLVGLAYHWGHSIFEKAFSCGALNVGRQLPAICLKAQALQGMLSFRICHGAPLAAPQKSLHSVACPVGGLRTEKSRGKTAARGELTSVITAVFRILHM